MAAHIPFTNNYQDLSNDQGFQFKFFCERCGNGYMSSFQHNAVGVAGEVMRTASNFFGGFVRSAANSSHNVERIVGGPAHDAAVRKAVEEISPLFHQCQRCGQWVCDAVCWNTGRNQCVNCSPKMDQEIRAIESEATIHQLRQQGMYGNNMTGGVQLQSTATPTTCPSCGKPVAAGQRFCGDCGADVQAKPKCPSCSAELTPGQRFCGSCGHQV